MTNWSWRKTVLVVAVVLVLVVTTFLIVTSPMSVGGSSTSTYTGPVRTTSLIVVSQKTWRRKGKVRHIGHHAKRTNLDSKTRATNSGPCYRVDAEVHGDSKLIDKVIQGWLHAKLCMKAGDHTQVLDRYTGASFSHKESWLWWFDHVDEVKGAGVSTNWCNGGVGPCLPVEYRYWRYVFYWKQGVSIFGQDIAHHKTLYVGCTLRAGPGGYQCGTGEA